MTPVRSDPQEIARALEVLFRPSDVVEMRVPKTQRNGVVSGYFDDIQLLSRALAAQNGTAPGVYVTLNPVLPALLARSANRVRDRVRTTTSDRDITERRWLLLDFDAVRPADISASEEEHEGALARAQDARTVLAEEGWPAPVFADSGNGAHLLFRVDLPNDDATTKLLEAVLSALAARFSDDRVALDKTVFNSARITKAYGTVAAKGDNLPDRPHRLSRIVYAPATIEPVPRELLEEVAGKVASPKPQAEKQRGPFNIEAWIRTRGLRVHEPVAHEGGLKWIFEECPFDSSHRAPDAALFQRADGSLAFKCFHNSCAGKHWADVRELFEGPRQRPGAGERGSGRSAGPRLEPKILTYGALKEVETPMQRVLFEDFPLPASGATLLFGQSKAGKTIFGLQVALSIARGKPLLDYFTLSMKAVGAVMVIEQDDPESEGSIRDLVEKSGGGPDDMPFYLVPRLPFSFGPALLDWLGREIIAKKLVMVLLDSYTALRGSRGPGLDIVKAEQFELAQLDELGKRLQCSIVIIHHDSTGKAGRNLEWCQSVAGTFAMSAATEAQIHIARFSDLDIKAPERLVRARARHASDMHLVLRFRKETMDYDFVFENSAAALYPQMQEIKREFGAEPFGIKSLSQATGASRTTAFRLIDKLRSAGAIQKIAYGEYTLVNGI